MARVFVYRDCPLSVPISFQTAAAGHVSSAFVKPGTTQVEALMKMNLEWRLRLPSQNS